MKPKQQKQKPEHSNLIYQTTTRRSKEENKQKTKPTKGKANIRNKRFLKARTKNLKNLQKISVFFKTSPVNLGNTTFLRTPKTPMCTISVSVCLFSV